MVVSINAAFTKKDGLIVQSIANYILDSTKYGFSESFHLVFQNKGWYVHSCLFKWHDESPEHAKSKDDLPSVVEEPNHELANGHAEAKKPSPETDAAVTEEVKKSSDEAKVSQPKDRILTNGTSTPPSTPVKNNATPTKNTATPTKNTSTPSKNASTPAKNATTPSKTTPAPQNDVKTPRVVPSAPPAPASWAACVGGGVKSATASVANTNVKSAATTDTNNAASDVTVKPPTTTTTAAANANTSANVEGSQDKQHRNKKPPRAKSDYTVHVSKIVKGKKAAEKDVVVDLTKAFQGLFFLNLFSLNSTTV